MDESVAFERNTEYDFEELVMQYVNDIRKLIYSYVKNHQTTEDLTQEVFIAAYKGLANYRGESSVKTWLMKIAINKSKDYLKSWHFKRITLTQFFYEKADVRNTEKEFLDSLRNQELARIIMELPIKYREIIILYYYHDLDLKEISDLTGINVNTAKTRLTRGRDLIKRRSDLDGSFKE